MRSFTIRRTACAAACAVLLAAAGAAVGQAAAGTKAPPARRVFAHYMACLSNGVDFARQEIELAQRHGIDGFALNCLNWGRIDPKTGRMELKGHGKGAADVYEAARQLDSGFKLFVSADVNGDLSPLPQSLLDMVERFGKHPNQFQHDGKVVLSAWAGGPETYAEGCRLIREKGWKVHFVPFVSTRRYPMSWSFENLLRLFRGHDHMDGWFHFACDGQVNDILRINAMGRRVTQYLGKTYMAGVCPAYNSPNLRDFRGMSGYAAMWRALIRDGADWVEIVTWNDYNEDSNLMPYRWKEGWERQYFNRDESFLDVTAYYAAQFKTGRPPAITQDKVFFVYRNRPKRLTRAWDPKTKQWVDITRVKFPCDQIHDDVGDFVYVTTFLTAPASVSVRVGGTGRTFSMPAGISHAELPLVAGVPRVSLHRGGKVLARVIGRKLIVDKATKRNSPYGYHLLNRTWANGVAVGPARRIEAESGKLLGGAEIVHGAPVSAVQNREEDGSGFAVPVKGLATATYNVRITYSNPAPTEARLTLTADGPPRAAKRYPYYIPAFLPPTGEGRFATVSFFWSLYEKTTKLELLWRAGTHYDKVARQRPLFDDHGRVLVDAIELVKVEPVRPAKPRESALPEMVFLPGGSFVMGSRGAEADEAPPHKVKVSPFALGTFEVTNEEFERFDPSHRPCRDGYSWRDREPVIYVSWVDGARYCNWLSGRAGLGRAYDEKTWALDANADGFRLPTEAQWEYAASGRGEGRKYPWGNERPAPGRHGNFAGPRVLRVDDRLRGVVAAGTAVVGSYPAGASRDGVMDLAGNVGEWCGDFFAPYAAADATDPLERGKANYRSIRGGSWGYYGLSQRCADREFNNPGYGGYVYIGLRVALPEAGWKKLRTRP